jgi:signal transduction histidine kinase
VLQKKPSRLWKDLIIPQLERYADRLAIQGISVAHLLKPRSPGEDLEIKVDQGLISQVLANLFSNVAKYAKTIDTGSGKRKQMNCQTVFMQDFFGKGHDGIKIEVFSSGPPLAAKDSERIFDEGYRVTDGEQVEGTGHGLHFVKNVIEVHGGIVGHTTEKYGNQFYFVIPS